jgi:hypothetical protein
MLTTGRSVAANARESIAIAAVFRFFSSILSASKRPIPHPIAAWEMVSNAAEDTDRATGLRSLLVISQSFIEATRKIFLLLSPIQLSILPQVSLIKNGLNRGLLRFLERLMTYE